MSKIDLGKKQTTTLTPGAEAVSEQLQNAADYTKRIRERQAQTQSAKAEGMPVGGAPPVPRERAEALSPMAQPSWDADGPSVEGAHQVHQPPGGVGSGYEASPAISSSPPTEEAPEEAAVPSEETEDAGVVREEDFDFDDLGRVRNQLVSKERKEAIEARLSPLKVSDLITTNEIRQTVASIPGQLEYEIRTIAEHEHLYCMQYVYDYTGSPRFIEELFNTAKIACSIIAINGKMLPEHRKRIGQRDEEVEKELFDKKMSVVKRFATQLLADVGVQLTWFNERVNGLFSVEKIKNG